MRWSKRRLRRTHLFYSPTSVMNLGLTIFDVSCVPATELCTKSFTTPCLNCFCVVRAEKVSHEQRLVLCKKGWGGLTSLSIFLNGGKNRVFGGLEGGTRFEDMRVLQYFSENLSCFLEAFVMEIGQLFFIMFVLSKKCFCMGWE